MKSKKKRSPRPEASAMGALKAFFTGLAVFICVAVPTVFAAAAVAILTPDPGVAVLPLGLAALYASSFAGGFAACRKNGGMALLSGAICGVGLVLITLLASLALPGSLSFDGTPTAIFCTRLPIIAASVLGAYAATVKRAPKRRKRRK